MQTDLPILRSIEAVVDALVRLDEQVRQEGGSLGELLRLRTAQAIAGASERPPEFALDAGDGHSRTPSAGEASFADPSSGARRSGELREADVSGLIGWWFVPESRALIGGDPFVHAVAAALDVGVGRVRNGSELTPGLVDEMSEAGGFDDRTLPDLLDASLSVALREEWPPLLIAGDLGAGACGRVPSLAATMLRAIAPVAAGLTSDVLVRAPSATDVAGTLAAVAREARAVHCRVGEYRVACDQVEASCREFGRGAFTAVALARALRTKPAVTVAGVSDLLGVSAPTAGAAVDRLVERGALGEITGRGRDRVFVYAPAVALAG